MLFSEGIANFSKHSAGLIRFYREDENFRKAGQVRIEGGGFCAGFFCESSAGGFDGVTGDDLFRRHEVGANEAFGESGGHFPRAEKTYSEAGGHGGVVTGQKKERKGKG